MDSSEATVSHADVVLGHSLIASTSRCNLTSTIKIAVYVLSPTGQRVYLKKSPLAECKVRGIDLLNEGVEHDLTNGAGAKIIARLAVTLDVTLEFRADFMKTVDKDLARLAEVRGADGAQSAVTVGEKIGTIIQKIMPIIDNFASSHSVLKLGWIALSSTYKATQTQVAEDSTLRDLVDSLHEMTSAASAYLNLLEITDAADFIDAIGRTSLDVALLVRKHTDITLTGKASISTRAARVPFPDMSSQIAECQRRCGELTAKVSSSQQIQTTPEVQFFEDGARGLRRSEDDVVSGDRIAGPSQLIQRTTVGPTLNAIGVSGTVTMVAGNFVNGDYNVVQEGASELQEGVDEIQDAVKLIHDKQKGLYFLSAEDRAKFTCTLLLEEAINKWMAAPDTSPNYKAAREEHQLGTGSWLVDGSIFEEWKAHPDSVLWLHGGPGCGKTILCSSAIENVKQSCKNKGLVGYAYYFFDGTSAQSKLAAYESLIRSMIMQFSDRLDGIHPALAGLYDVEDKGRHQPLISSLEATLLELIKSFPASYIIIDALDECAEQHRLLKWIHSITLHTWGSLHLMVTSRPEPDIKGSLRSLFNIREIDLMSRQASDDILEYIDTKLSEITRWTESQKQLVREALSRGAGGVFRWVALLFDELERCLSTSELHECLSTLPKDLNEAYMKIIKRSPRPADVIRFLQWIIFGRQEFTARELAEVALINFGNGGDVLPFCDSSRRYSSPDDVLRACSGLVVEVKEGITIKLAHLSVKEFLLSTEIPLGPIHSIRIDESLSHCVIAEFNEPESIINDNLQSFPLAVYASEHCVFHVQAISCRDTNLILKRFMETLAAPGLETSYALNNWTRLRYSSNSWGRIPELEYGERLDGSISSLHFASIIGLAPLVDHLINCGADINALGGRWGTALQAASLENHLAICQLLLARGAEANAMGGRYGTALQAASHENHLAICQLLLARGADANAMGGRYGTALQAASHENHLPICQLLLERGADVDAMGGQYGTALQAASYRSRLEICQLLLKHGADVNAMGGQYGTALQAVSCIGRIDICQLLLEHGADVNAMGGYYGTALQAASSIGRLDICQVLVERGADVNAIGGWCGTALQAASCAAGIGIRLCQLLLEQGADVNAIGGQYGTALQAASYEGRLEICQLLLEHGADVNAMGGKYGSALQAASYWGKLEICQLLLEHGADVDAMGGEFGAALQAASLLGHLEICQLLLEHGADVNAMGDEDGTALQAASYQGHLGICQLLLEQGADVNAAGGEFSTALQAASFTDCLEICQLLLERGANVNAMGGEYGTALQAALGQGNFEICQLLLDHGADVNITAGEHGTALNAARAQSLYSWKWKSEVAVQAMVQLLKEYGAVETEALIQSDES
ncbi:hypothetical protein HWV62_30927 [Athelia sp. TMB]|nr:hypothetical protein HWV62_30927 [Athelia sp. TMB]